MTPAVAEWWQDFFRGRWEAVQLGLSDDVDANRAAAKKIERCSNSLRSPPFSTCHVGTGGYLTNLPIWGMSLRA